MRARSAGETRPCLTSASAAADGIEAASASICASSTRESDTSDRTLRPTHLIRPYAMPTMAKASAPYLKLTAMQEGTGTERGPPLPKTPHVRRGLPPTNLVEVDRLADVALLEWHAIEDGRRHASLLALLHEPRCSNPSRVRNDRRAAPGECAVEHSGDQRCMWLLVQHVRGNDELETPDIVWEATPVADTGVDQCSRVHQHVECGETQRFLVVVCRRDVEARDRGG